MVQQELDSFYFKFKNLLLAEKDATLTFKSEAGRASVTLALDLGHVLSGLDQLPQGGHRNGPARQRRREKRAAARAAAEEVEVKGKEPAEKVEEEPNSAAEEANRIEPAAKANEIGLIDDKKDTEEVDLKGSVDDLVVDEFCSNASYNEERKEPTPSAPPPTTFRSPPPSTPRGLGGIDYYNKTYDEDDG